MKIYLGLLLFPMATLSLARAQGPWTEKLLHTAVSMGALVKLEVADMDGDGDNDVLFGGTQTGAISWFENTGATSPFVGHVVFLASSPHMTRACDVDGDGDFDVVSAWNSGSSEPAWFENDGGGGGWTPHPFLHPSATNTIGNQAEIADLDGDGMPDMVVSTFDGTGLGYETLALYRGTGSSFVYAQTLSNSSDTGQTALADLDGDGDLDLINPSLDFATNPWIRNESTPGNFAFANVGGIPSSPYSVPTDMDGDGDLDVILVWSGSVYWSENLGTPTFGPVQLLLAPDPSPGTSSYYEAAASDLDGDGDGDLLVAMRPTNTTSAGTVTRIAAFENLGNGTLGPRVDLRSGSMDQARIGFGVGDLDGDGDYDVVGTRVLTATQGVLLWHRNDRIFGEPVSTVCVPTANSSGTPGSIALTGSFTISEARTHLVATGLPPGVFGYFLVATQSRNGIVPPGSFGPLCLGGSIGRFNGLQQILTTDGAGSMVLPIDLFAVPSAAGPGPILSGETRVFQGWHRDPAWSTSNFTDAIEVLFL